MQIICATYEAVTQVLELLLSNAFTPAPTFTIKPILSAMLVFTIQGDVTDTQRAQLSVIPDTKIEG